MTQPNTPAGDAGNPSSSRGNGLDVEGIHPRHGAKFSPNLHKWLTHRERKYRGWTSRVYRDAEGVLWVGMLDDGGMLGARLYGVLCNGSQEPSACWVNLKGLVELDGFWLRYMADGRCAIDTEHARHFVGDDTRWTVDGDARSCLWCGKARQVLARWTETVERQKWLPAAQDVARKVTP